MVVFLGRNFAVLFSFGGELFEFTFDLLHDLECLVFAMLGFMLLLWLVNCGFQGFWGFALMLLAPLFASLL